MYLSPTESVQLRQGLKLHFIGHQSDIGHCHCHFGETFNKEYRYLISIFSTGFRDSMQQAVSDLSLCNGGLRSDKLSVSEQSLLEEPFSSARCCPFFGNVSDPIRSLSSCNICQQNVKIS